MAARNRRAEERKVFVGRLGGSTDMLVCRLVVKVL